MHLRWRVKEIEKGKFSLFVLFPPFFSNILVGEVVTKNDPCLLEAKRSTDGISLQMQSSGTQGHKYREHIAHNPLPPAKSSAAQTFPRNRYDVHNDDRRRRAALTKKTTSASSAPSTQPSPTSMQPHPSFEPNETVVSVCEKWNYWEQRARIFIQCRIWSRWTAIRCCAALNDVNFERTTSHSRGRSRSLDRQKS